MRNEEINVNICNLYTGWTDWIPSWSEADLRWSTEIGMFIV